MMVDLLSDGDSDFGVDVFDGLQRNQKIAALHTIGRALLTENEPAPRLTAAIESAVASVYQHVREMLFQEIEDGSKRRESTLPTWRELVLAAARKSDEINPLPHAESSNKEEWEFVILCLEGQVLWDNDWEIQEHLDVPPERSRRWKQQLGISYDYFVAVPPDPSDAQAELLLVELRRLTPHGR